MDGFSDFYKAEWLQHILRQQDAELGCFGKDSECLLPHERKSIAAALRANTHSCDGRETVTPERSFTQEPLSFPSDYILSQIIGDELLEQLQPHRRVKRREKILPGWSRQMVGASVQ